MDLAEFIYQSVVNLPSRTGLLATLAAAAVLVVLAGVMLAGGKVRWLARGLGIVGVILVLLVLWLIHEQTITEKQGPRITVTRWRYTPSSRLAVRAGLFGLPLLAGAVMLTVLRTTQRGQRAEVPQRLKEGRKHLVQKEYDAALREYNHAIRTAPQLAEPYLRRGSVYLAMGETALALADFDRALERDPRLAPAYLARGKTRTASGDLDGALVDFAELMRIQGNDPESYLCRGICLAKKGCYSDAVADFQRVLKLTNHTDFAEPAKNYLRECEDRADLPAGLSSPNGSPALPGSPQPRAQEFRI